jgi:adenylate cyclase
LEAWQRALWHWPKGGELATMRSFLQRAMALDPRFAPPHAIEPILYLAEATRGFGPPPTEAAKLAEVEARKAIELDPESALGHAALGWVFHNQSDPRLALEEAETAITLNPNEPWGHLCKGHVLVFSGQPAEAQEPLRIALRLDPYGPAARIALHDGTIGLYFEWNYPAAETTVRRAISAYPRFPRLYPWLAAALGQIGRLDEAHSALDAAITISPTYFKFITGSPPFYYRPGDHEHLLEGLRKAGWDG